MKKVYGNHLGIVIDNDDPENRNRIQIYIPHLTNTLYKNWNERLLNKVFKHVAQDDVFTDDVLERLKKSLPWAECASPIFGGSTGAVHNPVTRKTSRVSEPEETFKEPNPDLPPPDAGSSGGQGETQTGTIVEPELPTESGEASPVQLNQPIKELTEEELSPDKNIDAKLNPNPSLQESNLFGENTDESSQPVANLNPNPNQISDSTVGGIGSSVGFYSTPLIGAKVWVFFHGGDVQRPVYFATALTSEDYRNVKQNASPSPKENVNEKVFASINQLKAPPGSLTFQSDVENHPTMGVINNSSVTLENMFGSFLKFVRGDTVFNTQGNLTEMVFVNKWSTVKGIYQKIVGNDKNEYIQGDLKILVGEQTDEQVQAAKKIQENVQKIQKSTIDSIDETEVDDPIVNQPTLLKGQSTIEKFVRKIFDYIPYKPWQFLFDIFEFLPLNETRVKKELAEQDIVDENKTKVPDFTGTEEAVKKAVNETQPEIDENTKKIKGGNMILATSSDFSVVAGLALNDVNAFIKKGKTAICMQQQPSKDGSILVSNSVDNIDKAVYVPPPITFGNINLVAANKLILTAGSPGVDITSNGRTSLKSGSLEIISSEGETTISSSNITNIGGKIVHINGDDRTGKGGVRISSKNTMVGGAFHVAGDSSVKGSLTIDGDLTIPHLNTVSMRSETQTSSSAKSVTQKAVWFNAGASIFNAIDINRNLIFRNWKPGWILLPSSILTIIQETYNDIALNLVFEPLEIGYAITPLGVYPVIGFTHTHELTPQDHVHELTLPKGTYMNDENALGQIRKRISHVPTPSTPSGDGPSPGPKSSGGCGGGGFGFGSENSKASLNRIKRNSKYGFNGQGFDYTNIITKQDLYEEDGELKQTEFSLKC
jgi:hypothetical protein